MECDGFPAEDYALYILGNLTGPERQEIQSHLAENCERCRFELQQSSKAWYRFGTVTPISEPRRSLRAKVLAVVSDAQESHRGRSFWAWGQVFEAFALLSAALLIGWFVGTRQQTPTITASPRPSAGNPAVSVLEAENARLRTELTRANRTLTPPPPLPQPRVPDRPNMGEQQLAGERASLQRDLAESRQTIARLETNLSQQNTALANATRAAEEANRRASAAVPGSADLQTVRAQLVTAQGRAQSLERQVNEYQFLLTQERRRSAGASQLVSLLENPSLKLIRLRTTERGGNGEGNALVSAGSQVVFYGSQLPPLPPGRVYQLWLIRDRNPAIVSAGTFAPDNQNRAIVDFRGTGLTSNVTGLAVTDEPAGGSQTPTGHKLLVGS